MKRKDFEDAYDDFSCFSLAASARKSRRLDCELPTIIEEEPVGGIPIAPAQGFWQESSHSGNVLAPDEAPAPVVDAVIPNDPSQELALVLYNPENAATQGLVKSPSSSNLSVFMSPELLSEWRSQMFHQGNQSRLNITELDEGSDENYSFQASNSTAVVPWVAPSQLISLTPEPQAAIMTSAPMEADAEYETMENDDPASSAPGYINQGYIMSNGMGGGAVVLPPQPQMQPHCLLPQFPPNTYTPIRW